MRAGKAVRLGVISLGCPKNLIDTERALGQMLGENIVLVADVEDADWVLINTCGFIEDAKDEAKNTIREMASLKKRRGNLKIAVAGCLSERYGERLLADLDQVDFLTGVLTRENVRRLSRAVCGRPGRAPHGEGDDRQRLRITPRHTAYLRITEGCNNRCSYCAIPDIRGPLHSRPFENIMADAEELLSDGVVELNVIGQDTTAYGTDFYEKYRLSDVLTELGRLNRRGWVRLLYAHPAHLDDAVIDVLLRGAPFVPYVDLPLQHINDRILADMGRKVSRARIESLVKQIRYYIPGAYIRTTFIVGFPGETEGEFRELVDFVKAARFERLGVFAYSREDGTPAADFAGQIDEDEKERRRDVIMTAQAEIAAEFNRSLVGRKIEAIIDGPSGRDDLALAARTYGDAPEVDGTVYVPGGVAEGRIVQLKITGVEGYDLLAEVAR